MTSSDVKNYDKLADFITQLGRFYDNSTIVIYDLGMGKEQVKIIRLVILAILSKKKNIGIGVEIMF